MNIHPQFNDPDLQATIASLDHQAAKANKTARHLDTAVKALVALGRGVPGDPVMAMAEGLALARREQRRRRDHFRRASRDLRQELKTATRQPTAVLLAAE